MPGGETAPPHWAGAARDQQLIEAYTEKIQGSLGPVDPEKLARDFTAAKPDDPQAWVADQLPDLMGEKMAATFADMYHEAGALGWISAKLQVERVKDSSDPWQGWSPGDPEAAKLFLDDVEGLTGLQAMLDRRQVTIKGIEATRYMELGNVLQSGLESGASMGEMAAGIRERLGMSNGWAETVARTETRFAVTAATRDSYKDSGVGQIEWATAGDPGDECSDYQDAGPQPLDEPDWDGLDGPPAHPNCLCVVLPVVPEG